MFERYKRLNSNPSESSRGQADGLLIGFIERGARARMLASVFNVGRGRYERLKSGAPRMTPGGKRNGREVIEDDIKLIHRMTLTLPTESASSCSHRKLDIKYITDEEISSIDKLHEKYYIPFEADKRPIPRKLAKETFRKYLGKCFPEIKLDRLQEDMCDICVEFKTALKDPNLLEVDREHLSEALKVIYV